MDSLVSVEVVTYTDTGACQAQILTANASQNADLYWVRPKTGLNVRYVDQYLGFARSSRLTWDYHQVLDKNAQSYQLGVLGL
jgi:hypothetical protein